MLAPEQIEIIENSFLADLYDFLQTETDEEVISAIETQIRKIEN